MPVLGADMERGTLSRWRVTEGDHVTKGDIIADVDTDKATMEVEVFETGVVERLLVQEGETVPVGTALAVLVAAGETAMAASPSPVLAPSGDRAAAARDDLCRGWRTRPGRRLQGLPRPAAKPRGAVA